MQPLRKGNLMKPVFASFTLLLLLVSGCNRPPAVKHTLAVERVFQTTPGCYSFLYRKGNELINFDVSKEYPGSQITSCRLMDDADPKESMYAEIQYQEESLSPNDVDIVIHVHSVQDIETADYQRKLNKHETQKVTPSVVE